MIKEYTAQSINSKAQGLSLNNIHIRMNELLQLLQLNNQKFPQALPSQNQFKSILDHCFNCYDQLDFISQEYSKQTTNYLDPKIVAEYLHKITRSTKYIFNNIRHWVDTFSLDSMKILTQRRFDEMSAGTNLLCSLCNNHFEDIAIQQVKKELCGQSDLKAMFQQELREAKAEKQKKEVQKNPPKESKEYIHSVNYITKIIREMEQTAHGYDKFVEKIQKDEDKNDDVALRFLEELIVKMKIKLGQKCKVTLKKMVKGWEGKQCEQFKKSDAFQIDQQVNLMVVVDQRNKKRNYPTPQDILMQRLKEQNYRLQAERNNLNVMYASTKQILQQMEQKEKQSKFMRELDRRSSIENNRNDQRTTTKGYNSSKNKQNGETGEHAMITKVKVIKEGILIVKPNNSNKQEERRPRKKGQGTMKKLSIFNVRRQSKMSQVNTNDKTSDISENNLEHDEKLKSMVSLGYVDQEQQECDDSSHMIDVGCQWQDIDQDRRLKKLLKKTTRQHNTFREIDLDDRKQDNLMQTMMLNKSTKTLQRLSQLGVSQGQKYRTSISKLDLQKNVGIKGGNDPTSDFIKEQTQNRRINRNKSRNQTESRQTQYNQTDLDQLQNQRSANIFGKKEKLSQLNQNVIIQVNQQTEKSINYKHKNKNNRINNKNEKMQRKTTQQNTASLVKSVRMEIQQSQLNTNKDKRELSQIKKNDKKGKMQRFATEMEQTQKRKERKIKNTLFKPQHLSFFGGVSQSYAYQKTKFQQKEQTLTEAQKQQFNNLFRYILNLKGFKNSYFQNVISFISHPFELIQKNQIALRPSTEAKVNASVLKLLMFHKRKCGHINCQHIANFGLIIGYQLSQ